MRQRWAEHHGWRRRRLGRGGARGEGGNRGRRRPSPDPATMAGARPPHNAVAGEVEEEGGRRRRSPGPLPTPPVPRRLPAPSLPHRMPHAARRTAPGLSPPSPSHRNTHPAHAAPSAPRSPVPVPQTPCPSAPSCRSPAPTSHRATELQVRTTLHCCSLIDPPLQRVSPHCTDEFSCCSGSSFSSSSSSYSGASAKSCVFVSVQRGRPVNLLPVLSVIASLRIDPKGCSSFCIKSYGGLGISGCWPWCDDIPIINCSWCACIKQFSRLWKLKVLAKNGSPGSKEFLVQGHHQFCSMACQEKLSTAEEE
ncbi:hypothetical protein BS78_K216300 [Paspalum vaginatum]|uniref:FLZ-type domain-containing protein n=1 Tax=Paspalum vaginatum TaxID=158149 RepID=A0A9W8CE57_9POAL|nr:hypothetical protein BS78_K216300 [Paspalum vaginatum]